MARITFVKLVSRHGDMIVNLDDVAAVTCTSDNCVKVLSKTGNVLVSYGCTDAAQVRAQLAKTTDAVLAAADEHNANLPDGVMG